VTCQVGAAAASDAANNNNATSNNASVTYDSIAPTVLVTPSGTVTGTSPITFTLTFSESVSGLTSAGITVTNGSKGTLSGSGTTYTLPVTPSGQGAVTCQVGAAAAHDAANNNNTASNNASVTYDSVGPMVTISAPSVSSTASGPVTYTVTYADANFSASTLVAGNITLNQTGNANGTVSLAGTGTTRTVTISSITGTGTLGISIGAGTASDTVGNLAGAAGPSGTFIVTTPFDIWINSFPGLSVANRVLAADPDGDSLNNLLEYALGGNPTIASPAPLPQSNTKSGKLALILTRTLSTTDLALTVQASDSPAGPWTDLASSVNGAAMAAQLGGVTVLETGSGATRSVEVRDLYLTTNPAHTRRFMRLQVRK